MTRRDTELGAFLRSRRQAARPDRATVLFPGPRRVPGLRREELAAAAGISVSYYTRIEQGRGGQASPAVLSALARVLVLDDHERGHLHRLAGWSPQDAPAAVPEQLRIGLAGVVRHLHEVPAGVLGRGMDVLAWNPVCHALIAPHIPFDAPDRDATRPNWARLLFTDARCREPFLDWAATARDLVGRLRTSAGRLPGDPHVDAVVAELRAGSAEFRALWSTHPVQGRPLGLVRLRHPVVGDLELHDEILVAAEDSGQTLVTFHAEPGSTNEKALHALVEHVSIGRIRG